MTSQDLLHQSGLGEAEARWQRHVMVALWLSLAFVIVAGVGLAYASAHGLFQSLPTGVPPWPTMAP